MTDIRHIAINTSFNTKYPSMNSLPVFDGHNDTLGHYYLTDRDEESFFQENTTDHLDLAKAQQGGFAGGMFALFVPHPDLLVEGRLPKNFDQDIPPAVYKQQVSNGYATRVTDKAIASLNRLEKVSKGVLKKVSTTEELTSCLATKTLAAVMHFEGAEAIREDLNNLQSYYKAGLRSLGLVWSRDNVFGCGVEFGFPGSPDTGPGLTTAGKELIQACNALGIVVDLSHLNEKGFWDVARISSAPLIASHSCVHALCPTPRNLTDQQLDAIKESEGLVGINFCVKFLRPDGAHNQETPLEVVAEHFLYIADRIGVEHIAFGSDFDGATIPSAIKDVTGLPKLIAVLREKGFSEQDLRMITHGNWLRILTQTWKE